MGKTCLIISGGEFCTADLYRNADLIIACDKGLEYAERDGIKPDVILGDFDSYEGTDDVGELDAIRYPKEKDDTDTMLAVKYALDHDCSEIIISSALGRRMDHAFANIQSGAYAAERGASTTILGSNDIIHCFSHGVHRFKEKKGWSFSVFSLSNRCDNVSIHGTKYEVEDVTLINAFPVGVSNEWSSGEAEVSFSSGTMMVIESLLR